MAAQRSVLHVDLDAFFVSVERVLDPSLRARPVVVGGSPERRGVVAAASYEARAHGVRSAMPMARAMQICPDLVRVSGSHRVYRRASKAVFGILGEQVPVIEKVSVDEAYLDLTGTHMVLGKPVDTAEKIRREVRERLQLDLTVGVSRNRLVSKVASAFAKPQGLFEVHAGQEARFLAPLPVKLLPGVGPVTEKRLLEFNIARLGGLATTESWFLESVFGSHGPAMQQRARGEDDTPVCPPWEQPREKSMGHEETFAEDTGEHAFLRAKLQEMLASAARRMRQKGMLARKLTLRLRWADFVTASRDITLPLATDHDGELLRPALDLLRRMHDRRILVRLLGVRLGGLCRGYWQGQLGAEELQRERGLVSALDGIRARYGNTAVRSGEATRLSPERRPLDGRRRSSELQ